MVLIASLAVLALVAVIFSVTASSRRVSARYQDFTGLYELAKAGNEQAFLFISRAFEDYRHSPDIYTVDDIMPLITARLHAENLFFREWQIYFNFSANGYIYEDSFNAFTTIAFDGNDFRIDTHIQKHDIDGVLGRFAQVRSYARWHGDFPINCLDDYTLKMVELMRIAD